MAGPDRITRLGPAILAGTLTGGVSMTLWLAVGASLISDSSGDLGELLLAIPMVLILFTTIALMLVVVASVGVGLPLSWLLNRFNRESRVVYTIAGAITGTGVLLLVAYWIQGPRFPSTNLLEFIAPGALSGAVSGWTWGSNIGAMAPPSD
jgi:hypothetical protein